MTPHAAPFRLETFGTLVLREPDGGTLLADHGQQGRRLALLAVLAASGERGTSRDRLLLLFWPEASQRRARHSLEQMLYKARQAFGGALFAGVNPLRLDPAVVTSDVEDFERAMRAEDFAAAAAHYAGPFLDGFYLEGTPEFSEWVVTERARLEAEYVRALERLAKAADENVEPEIAVRWWSRLCEVDPLSGRNSLGLIRALASAGDPAAALRHAEHYERLVEEELGTSAGPEVEALAAEIRAGTGIVAPVDSPSSAGESPAQGGSVSATPDAFQVGTRAREVGRAVPRRAGRLVPYAIAALTLAAGAFAATRLWRAPPELPVSGTDSPSIAVLPLTQLGGDPSDEGLADGMTEELISVLSRTGDLRVISGTTTFAFADRRMDVRQIADSLRVSHVLEGGVRKIGPRLRMQVRLVDARDGSTLWSETYDREFADVFDVQEEIAAAVARELGLQLAGGTPVQSDPPRGTTNIVAYEWYLRGMDLSLLRSEGGNRQGIEYFQRAIAADSNYAAAYAGLVRMYLSAGSGSDDSRVWYERAEQAALQAVRLDDSLAEAHAALGWARIGKRDFVTAEAELQRAIALDPRVPRGHEGLARVYMWTGRPLEQLAEARSGVASDPLSHSAIRELALALLMNGRCDETLELLRPLKDLTPPAGVAGVIRGQCYAQKQMWPQAITEFRWAEEKSPAAAAPGFLGFALARAGREPEAREILSELVTGAKHSKGAFGAAIVHAGLRDYDQAFAWLDRAVDEGSIPVYIVEPVFEDLHRDPRYRNLAGRIGIQNR